MSTIVKDNDPGIEPNNRDKIIELLSNPEFGKLYSVYVPSWALDFDSVVIGNYYSLTRSKVGGEEVIISDLFDRNLSNEMYPHIFYTNYIAPFISEAIEWDYIMIESENKKISGVLVFVGIEEEMRDYDEDMKPSSIIMNSDMPFCIVAMAYPMSADGIVDATGLTAFPIYIIGRTESKEQVRLIAKQMLEEDMSTMTFETRN